MHAAIQSRGVAVARTCGVVTGKLQAPRSWQAPTVCRSSTLGGVGNMQYTYPIVSAEGSTVQVVRVPMFNDNYGWILRDVATGKVGAVDPAEPAPIAKALQERGWRLDVILNTHHHADHTGGNVSLKQSHNCTIIGPTAEKEKIPGIDTSLGDGETCCLGETKFTVFDTPGHTSGHIAFWAPSAEMLFPGDTLFAMGCGRLFEGTAGQMWQSLQKFMGLPSSTAIYCAHEYTQANARWAISVDPDNVKLLERVAAVDEMRAAGISTVPTTLALELETNPFLRPSDSGIRKTLGVCQSADDEEAWTAIRAHKNSF